jgi:penicillin amidase
MRFIYTIWRGPVKIIKYLKLSVLCVSLWIGALVLAHAATPTIKMPGLKAASQVSQDGDGIYHVTAANEADAYFLQGWVQARDRLFQMDYNRRLASGTLAELVGSAALNSDVQLRTIGLRRAAVRSLNALSPETRLALSSYSRGVNAWIAAAAGAGTLPPEYSALELTQVQPWEDVDSVVIGKLLAFGLSFDLDIDATVALLSYVGAGQALGFDGQILYSEDIDRSAPFDRASTIPDASTSPGIKAATTSTVNNPGTKATSLEPEALNAAKHYLEKIQDLPLFQRIRDKNKRDGSNLWAISSRFSANGYPFIANDPHLLLGMPSTFYPMGLNVTGKMNVFGSSLPGVPGVILGYNDHISWGSTNNDIDVTDTFQEELIPDSASPSGFSTLYKGQPEPVIPIPEVFRANQPGNGTPDDRITLPSGGAIPAATLIVPRRNNGPIIQADLTAGSALSVQYTGFSATREMDAFLKINKASTPNEFANALQYFDVGSQNFVVGDDRGNIAYFTSGEMPVREDLQAGGVNGMPPWFIRNGQGGNEWLPVLNRQPNQSVEFEVLPFAEMPKLINPPAGWFVNANNDPAGLTLDNNPLNQSRPKGGIFYLAYSWDRGFRAGRIATRIRERLNSNRNRRFSFKDMQSIQADVKLRDAEYFTPWITKALTRAKQPSANATLSLFAADAEIVEAVGRLAAWDFSTPTGILEGWDAGKPAGVAPSLTTIKASIAATLYSTWRSRFIANTVDAVLGPLPKPGNEEVLTALRNVLDNFDTRGGLGASGVNFFNVPGITDPAERRDVIMLKSLREALDQLASDEFKLAFNNSTNQDSYLWGKLHRIVFTHPLGNVFSIPPAGGSFPGLLEPLAGISTDGGFQTVDAASHIVRASKPDEFMFDAGPVRRFVSELQPGGARSESIWPGGTSGVLGSPFYFQFLEKWLVNDAIPLHLKQSEVKANQIQIENFIPSP